MEYLNIGMIYRELSVVLPKVLFVQYFITTVCVAGQMFQGIQCVTVEAATGSAAQAALAVNIYLSLVLLLPGFSCIIGSSQCDSDIHWSKCCVLS